MSPANTQWVEIFNDPFLLAPRPAASRDVRVGGVAMVFFGAFCCRAIVDTKASMGGSLGVLVGLRLLQMCWWASLRSAPAKK